jgi:hypothetical protein
VSGSWVYDTAVLQVDDLVGKEIDGQIVSGHQNSRTLVIHDLTQKLQYLLAGGRIELAGRLVGQD